MKIEIMKTNLIQTCLLAALLALPAVAQAQFNYTTNNSTITITGYTGSGGAVTIPTTINGLPVTSIGNEAFDDTPLTSVTIPDSVTNIGDGAFDDCSSLTNLTIPDSVNNIGDGAFDDCSKLTAITVDTNNAAYSSVSGVLFDKSQAALIQYPAGKADGAYVISSQVINIGDGAFADCDSLTNVVIGTNVITIGDGAFSGIGVSDPLLSVIIPNSVTNIGDSAFAACTSLTSVTIGNSVTSIGNWAFDSCTSLTNVTIPDSVMSIGDGAFYYCFSLTSVTIPSNVTSIGEWAFATGNTSLKSVYFKGNAPAVDLSVFSDDDAYDYNYNATVYYLPGTTGWDDFSANTGIPALPWLPLIQTTGDTSFGVRTNQFGFNIAWASGQTVAVEACTNLANPVWSPVATNTLTGDSSYFSDPQSSNYPARFYRLRSP
jgi:BspA type Leucine rich repeat region (6 copies)